MGTNDVRRAHEGTMTEVSALRAEFTHAMDTRTTGLPRSRFHGVSIPRVSIPDLFQRWQTFHTVAGAVTA
jgi:hypothetical protein